MYTELVMEAAGKKVTLDISMDRLVYAGEILITSLLKKNLTGLRTNRSKMVLQKRMHGLMSR